MFLISIELFTIKKKGIESNASGEQWDTKLFLFSLLISSLFIYNTKNKNIYAFDSKWFNFKTVFGFNVRLWFLPYFKSNKYNKGHSFERPSDLSNRLVNENIN